MPSFDELFNACEERVVNFQGKELFRVDCISMPKKCCILVHFVSSNSEWKQGVRLNVNGYFLTSGQKLGKKVIVWEDTALQDATFEVSSKDGVLWVYNAWDTGKGRIDAWWGGAAMIGEDIPNGRRYYCNDGHSDDNFDDIVFEVTILPQQEQGS